MLKFLFQYCVYHGHFQIRYRGVMLTHFVRAADVPKRMAITVLVVLISRQQQCLLENDTSSAIEITTYKQVARPIAKCDELAFAFAYGSILVFAKAWPFALAFLAFVFVGVR